MDGLFFEIGFSFCFRLKELVRAVISLATPELEERFKTVFENRNVKKLHCYSLLSAVKHGHIDITIFQHCFEPFFELRSRMKLSGPGK